MLMPKNFKFETKQLHSGQVVDSETKSRALPIYQTTAYVFDDTEHGANLFGLSAAGNIYTRITNTTSAALERRVDELEGGTAGLAVAAGIAAITYDIQGVGEAGDQLISSTML